MAAKTKLPGVIPLAAFRRGSPLAALPLPLRKASGFPCTILIFKAMPPAVPRRSLKIGWGFFGKAEPFRKGSGRAARASTKNPNQTQMRWFGLLLTGCAVDQPMNISSSP